MGVRVERVAYISDSIDNLTKQKNGCLREVPVNGLRGLTVVTDMLLRAFIHKGIYLYSSCILLHLFASQLNTLHNNSEITGRKLISLSSLEGGLCSGEPGPYCQNF